VIAGPTEVRFDLPQSSSASRFTAGRLSVLELEPVRLPARSVARSQPLRDDSLQPHLAGWKTVRPPRQKASLGQRSLGACGGSPRAPRRPWGQGVNPSAGRGEVIEPDGKGFPTLLFLHELTLFRGLRSAFVDVLNPVDRLAAVII
jgi:hypothetical protein